MFKLCLSKRRKIDNIINNAGINFTDFFLVKNLSDVEIWPKTNFFSKASFTIMKNIINTSIAYIELTSRNLLCIKVH